jgi:hypothetical protein
MTMAANAFSRYDAIGIREDLANTIYNISPTETPFVSAIGKRSAKNTFFEWQTDALAAASTTNAQLEGDDTASTAISPTTRVGNYTQIFKKVWTITGTLEATDRAGRKSENAYQMAKKGKELKRDMEATFLSAQVAVSGGTTTARQTAAFDSWLKTNTDNGNGGTGDYSYTTTPITARTAATTGTIRTFTETILKNIVKKAWNAGGEPDMLMVGPVNKQRASGFTGIATIRKDAPGNKPATIIGAADVYVSDFGEVSVVPNRFTQESCAFVIDPSFASVATLRPFFSEQLAKTGDSAKYHMIVECGLEVDNEAAHAVARDLQTT